MTVGGKGDTMNKRENAILELLSKHGRLEVASLAQMLAVSQVTMRKDLDMLERRGVIRREHGYAVFGGVDDVNNRLAIHYEEKRKIAREAAKLVGHGETVMIENGSCCTLLAETIAENAQDVTIVTNSAFIASYIRRIQGAQVVLLGGDFQNEAQVMVGPVLRICAEQFHVNKLFVGVDGFNEKYGFMADNHLRVQAVRDMAAQADQVIVLTESEKFGRQSVVRLNLGEKITTVVTDSEIDAASQAALARAHIGIIRV